MLPTTSPYLRQQEDDNHDRGKPSQRSSFSLASIKLHLRLIAGHPFLRPILSSTPKLVSLLLVILLLLVLLLKPTKHKYAIEPLKVGEEAKNWGDYVAQGHARSKILASTPSPYADLGVLQPAGKRGPLFFKYGATPHAPDAHLTKVEVDRHGILGGASVAWSSGTVGSGEFLGDVDMLVDGWPRGVVGNAAGSVGDEEREGVERASKRGVLTGHILENGWKYLDAEDEKNTLLLLEKAKKSGKMDVLPLRDRVRDDEEKRKEAAEGWANIYEAQSGDWGKSALEVAVERTVRSAPVVVFSKSECEHCTRARNLLAKYKLIPLPHFVEVDLRPDGKTLTSLLRRKTSHSTFPNIVIGSRSIGGADELEALDREGKLKDLLVDSGVNVR